MSYTSNTLSVSRCKSVQTNIGTVNFTTENEGIHREKSALKLPPLMKDQRYARLHETNEQIPTTSKRTFK